MKLLRVMIRVAESLAMIAFWVGAICIIILFLLMFGDIAGRFLFNKPIQGTAEISEYLLVSIAFLSLGYGQLKGAHVSMEAVFEIFPKKMQMGLTLFVLIVAICFFSIICVQIGERARLDWVSKVLLPSTSVRLPVWYTSFIASTGCGILVMSLFVQLMKNVVDMVDLGQED